MQVLQTDRQPHAVVVMTAGSVKPMGGVMFLSAGERANGMRINVGDVLGYDKQSKMQQLDAEVVME